MIMALKKWIDGICLGAGLGLLGLLSGEAFAAGPRLAAGADMALAAAGLGLLALPLMRRVMTGHLCHMDQCQDYTLLSRRLADLGLAQRVQGANLRLADLDDRSWAALYPDPAQLRQFLGPVYAVPHLRDRLHPAIRRRLDPLMG